MKTKFTKTTGHGNHWGCLGESTGELLKKFIPLTVRDILIKEIARKLA